MDLIPRIGCDEMVQIDSGTGTAGGRMPAGDEIPDQIGAPVPIDPLTAEIGRHRLTPSAGVVEL